MPTVRSVKKAKLEAATPHPILPQEFLLLLAEATVENVGALNGKLITVHREDSLSFAFKKLISNSILSVPVLKQDDTFYGFLDIIDIVTWLVDKMGEKHLENQEDIGEHPSFQETKVKQVMQNPISKKGAPYLTLKEGTSLLTALEMLADGAYRLAIVDDKHYIKHIISQSTVLDFIKLHLDKLGELKNIKVEEMDPSLQYVLSISGNQRAFDAFKIIKITNVGGIAITDDEGKLIGNISAKDFKKIASTGRFLKRLFQPAKEYLCSPAPITVTLSDNLEKVIREMTSKRVHRVYVVNDQKEPIGVISMGDVMKILLKKKQVTSK